VIYIIIVIITVLHICIENMSASF